MTVTGAFSELFGQTCREKFPGRRAGEEGCWMSHNFCKEVQGLLRFFWKFVVETDMKLMYHSSLNHVAHFVFCRQVGVGTLLLPYARRSINMMTL